MKAIYITSDQIGTKSGGGRVTYEEYSALSFFSNGQIDPLDRLMLGSSDDPFAIDDKAAFLLEQHLKSNKIDLAHIYAGTFTKAIEVMQRHGVKVAYTCAAHDRHVSAREFEAVYGCQTSLEHMKDGPLWERYVEGYRKADILIVPSTHSKELMIKYGCDEKRIHVIPHGTDLPATISPLPKQFTVGYMGSAGTDKGVRYLLEAWKKLNLKDAQLLIAGPHNQIPVLTDLYRKYGGGNVRLLGFVKTIDEFFDQISLYIQPSVTEGFGIEIIEAMAYGRAVIASSGAGASEIVKMHICGSVVEPCSSDAIAERIKFHHDYPAITKAAGEQGLRFAKFYTWGAIQNQYMHVWHEMVDNAHQINTKKTFKLAGTSIDVPVAMGNLDWDADSEIMERHWNVKPGDVCIDVGTGPGVWSAIALKKGASKVIAFDPRQVAKDILFEVVKLNNLDFSKLTFLNIGLWSGDGKMPFSESSFVWNTNGQTTQATVLRLDAYLENNKIERLDFMNIDAEGSELHVIAGAAHTLKKFRPKLLIDVHANVPIADLMKHLEILQPFELDCIGKYVIVTPH